MWMERKRYIYFLYEMRLRIKLVNIYNDAMVKVLKCLRRWILLYSKHPLHLDNFGSSKKRICSSQSIIREFGKNGF